MSDKKNKILIASLELFSKYGYSAVSMDMIKDKAQVAKGTLYYFFKNKDGLFQATWQYLFNNIRNYVLSNLKKDIVETKEDFINTILYSIDYLWENYENVKMFLISNRDKLQHKSGENQLLGNVIENNIKILNRLGISNKKSRFISIIVIGMIIDIFPGKFSGVFKKNEREYYKNMVYKVLHNLLGGIDEA